MKTANAATMRRIFCVRWTIRATDNSMLMRTALGDYEAPSEMNERGIHMTYHTTKIHIMTDIHNPAAETGRSSRVP